MRPYHPLRGEVVSHGLVGVPGVLVAVVEEAPFLEAVDALELGLERNAVPAGSTRVLVETRLPTCTTGEK